MQGLEVACIVLAAGRGLRYGMPKACALLPDGTRFLDAVVATARTAGIAHIVTVVRPDVEVPAGTRRVVNSNDGGEQVESVRAGLAALPPGVTGVLLWPVDRPLVTVRTLEALLQAVADARVPAAVPEYDGRRGHPAYFARETWPRLFAIREGGARAVLHDLGDAVLAVPVGDPAILADINAPADLANWLSAREPA